MTTTPRPTNHMNPPDPGIFRFVSPFADTIDPGLPRPAVFLDRDGVIVEEPGYLHSPDAVRLLPGAASAIQRLNAARIPTIVITNQAGIGRGYYGWKDFHLTQKAIDHALALAGAHTDALWACAYHPDGLGPYAADHPFRKPNPGMLLDASSLLAIDLLNSSVIGDKLSDLEAGLNAGLRRLFLVRTGYGADHESQLPAYPRLSPHVQVAGTLLEAVEAIISRGL